MPADSAAAILLHYLDLVERDALSLAQAMPADRYGFAPKDGNFDGVRTFAEQVKHLATVIYITAAVSRQEKPPYGPGVDNNGPGHVQSKDEIIAYLKASFAYARTAMNALTGENHLDCVPTYFGPMPRAAVLSGIAQHSSNHYGQMVVYARMAGIVPPTSVPTRE